MTIIAGVGDVKISSSLTLKNVLHVPKLSTNLFSVQKLTRDLCYRVIFHHNYCVFQNQNSGKMIGHARERDGLYYLEASSQSNITNRKLPSFVLELYSSNEEKVWLHQRRLRHLSFRDIKIIFPFLFQGLDVENFHCEVCELAKHTRVPFLGSDKRSSLPFYLIHSDIWGPSTIPNVFGIRWFVSFINDCTLVTWLFLLEHKSEVSTVLPNFCSIIKNQFGVAIKRFRSNNARDYFNQVLTSYFQKEEIIHESSCVNTPQQNGVAKRKMVITFSRPKPSYSKKNVPKSFLGKEILIATHLINRLPSRVLGFKSPMDILSTFYPNIHTTNNLVPKKFGCVPFVHVHSQNRGKLDPRTLNAYLWVIPQLKKGTSVITLQLKNFMSQWMLLSMKHLTSPNLIFRGRIQYLKIRIYLLSLPKLVSSNLSHVS